MQHGLGACWRWVVGLGRAGRSRAKSGYRVSEQARVTHHLRENRTFFGKFVPARGRMPLTPPPIPSQPTPYLPSSPPSFLPPPFLLSSPFLPSFLLPPFFSPSPYLLSSFLLFFLPSCLLSTFFLSSSLLSSFFFPLPLSFLPPASSLSFLRGGGRGGVASLLESQSRARLLPGADGVCLVASATFLFVNRNQNISANIFCGGVLA